MSISQEVITQVGLIERVINIEVVQKTLATATHTEKRTPAANQKLIFILNFNTKYSNAEIKLGTKTIYNNSTLALIDLNKSDTINGVYGQSIEVNFSGEQNPNAQPLICFFITVERI